MTKFYFCSIIVCLLSLSACASSAPIPAPNPLPSERAPTAVAIIVATPTPSAQATTGRPDCAPVVEKPITVPRAFPQKLPLAPGIEWYKLTNIVTIPDHEQYLVVGIAPMTFDQSIQFLQAQMPQAGYNFKKIDSETGEYDGNFNGYGWAGTVRVNFIAECSAATTWTLRVIKL